MPERNPYHPFVQGFARLVQEGAFVSLAGVASRLQPPVAENAPKVLLFSPHPDDECLTGALPLRLRREAAMNVIDVAVTLGSDSERRAERWKELTAACSWLGFGMLATAPTGLTRISPRTREDDPNHWRAAVDTIAAILADEQPAIVFVPHRGDRHPTHVGAHLLLFDALASSPGPNPRWIVETEYWGHLDDANLMVECSVDDVADLVAAVACHHGEVARNAYHLALPAGMIDAVRRGAELLEGHQAAAPACHFAMLYRVLRRSARGTIEVDGFRRTLKCDEHASELFVS
jgi:Uncharacterized proteins, LmbE homologs